jgi:hypothetical protein
MHDGGDFSSERIKKRPSEMRVFFLMCIYKKFVFTMVITELIMYCIPMAITMNPIILEIATIPDAPSIFAK